MNEVNRRRWQQGGEAQYDECLVVTREAGHYRWEHTPEDVRGYGINTETVDQTEAEFLAAGPPFPLATATLHEMLEGARPAWLLNRELLDAAEQGDLATVQRLFSEGATPNTTVFGRCALGAALKGRHFGVVSWLLHHGAALTWLGSRWVSPAGVVVPMLRDQPEDVALLKELLDAGLLEADPQRRNPLFQVQAPGIAALLLARGVPVDTVETRGFTPLLWALSHEQQKGVPEALIAAGADVNHRNAAGVCPLLQAVDYGRLDSLEALIAAGAEVNPAPDSRGRTPLAHARQLAQDRSSTAWATPMVAALERAGARATDSTGR